MLLEGYMRMKILASIKAFNRRSSNEEQKYKYKKKAFAEGGTSLLYKCQMRGKSEVYVAKVLRKECKGKLGRKRFNVECEMLQRFKGKTHIIQVVEILEDRIILPQMAEDLFEVLLRARPLSEINAKVIFKQICEGVQHLHNEKISHLDIKTENVLKGFDGLYYLADFQGALSEFLQEGDVAHITKQFAAPEIAERSPSNSLLAADMWSLGILLIEMLIYNSNYLRKGAVEAAIQRISLTYSAELCSLLRSLLQLDPKNRITISEVMSHPWLVNNS